MKGGAVTNDELKDWLVKMDGELRMIVERIHKLELLLLGSMLLWGLSKLPQVITLLKG